MQSDTLIGIAGAIVLVAVMVGVFAYEYNNTPPQEEPGDEGQQQMATFNATYPTLGAQDDIDGDGVPNWQDDDIDGDDTDNRNDTEIAWHHEFDGTLGQRSATDDPVQRQAFRVGTGLLSGTVTVTWQPTQGPVGGAVDNLVVTVTGPESAPCQSPQAGQATCNLDALPPGEYNVEIRHAQQVAPAKEYQGEIATIY